MSQTFSKSLCKNTIDIFRRLCPSVTAKKQDFQDNLKCCALKKQVSGAVLEMQVHLKFIKTNFLSGSRYDESFGFSFSRVKI